MDEGVSGVNALHRTSQTIRNTLPYLYFLPGLGVSWLQVKGVEPEVTWGGTVLDLQGRKEVEREEWKRRSGEGEVGKLA
jgi:hypothetical protein